MSNPIDDLLNEVTTTTLRRTKQSKRAAYAGSSAMAMARNRNDSLYHRYVKFNKKRLELKAKINQKYGTRATIYARKRMR